MLRITILQGIRRDLVVHTLTNGYITALQNICNVSEMHVMYECTATKDTVDTALEIVEHDCTAVLRANVKGQTPMFTDTTI